MEGRKEKEREREKKRTKNTYSPSWMPPCLCGCLAPACLHQAPSSNLVYTMGLMAKEPPAPKRHNRLEFAH